MSINQLILRNLKKNLSNYYLYVFALIFSVAIYFAFVTLQYDPSMDSQTGTVKGEAAVKAGSILLVAIVSIFLLYANTIFIKRRSSEIGLFQLFGMTKGRIFRILSIENFILYFSSLVIGIFVGFSISKLIVMIVYKITEVEAVATLRFSSEALIQTLLVFIGIYLLIMVMNYFFIKKQSILALFRVRSSTEVKIKKLSIWQVLIGILGIAMIATGYYVSQKLFDGAFVTVNELFFAMAFILGSVIIGTYFFYKGSVTFIFQLIRKQNKGYLNINKVMSLSSIMFRMKSNALLLTIITTVSALAIGLLCLNYISYYSAEQQAEDYVVDDFALVNEESVEEFTTALEDHDIQYTMNQIEVFQVEADISDVMDFDTDGASNINMEQNQASLPIVSDTNFDHIDLNQNEALFTGYSDIMMRFMTIKDSGDIVLKGQNVSLDQDYLGLNREYLVSSYFTNGGGMPLGVVDQSTYETLRADMNPDIQKGSLMFTGINVNKDDLEKANDLFHSTEVDQWAGNDSQLQMSGNQKMNMGLTMFIVGFLGLTFLVTSGCVLYFKQMDESESEKSSYTILRKLGFTQMDLLKGIQLKQVFNFGIPLAIGLLHSYFAVQSGWFFFGTELWTPMFIVMGLYTALYSVFGVLSVIYYRKVIREAL
ncbi:ABC transporter permease [Tenuibacillus multivorans]|uniref:Bacitracin transport system permease protein n=1 Tax=Tenuibacillus multivorans TaxID=237069 RepID=A0A1G9WL73_9BACI|nr:ABC transporter permease [Tenuibacillus multivorans]GEL76498.1 bacitracin export permease protein BceB [Tenuibacillus multivorans]SDM84906.1 bacitracin transport system permease protein [Tenuibacillus multivorans]